MKKNFENILKLKFQKFEECLRLKLFEIWNRLLRPLFCPNSVLIESQDLKNKPFGGFFFGVG